MCDMLLQHTTYVQFTTKGENTQHLYTCN